MQGFSSKIGKSVLARTIHFSLRTSDSVAGGSFSSQSCLDRLGDDSNLDQRPAPLYPLGYRHYCYTAFNDWTRGCSGILHGRSRTFSVGYGPVSYHSGTRADADFTWKIGGRRSVSMGPASHVFEPLLVDWWCSSCLWSTQGFPWNPDCVRDGGHWRKVRRIQKASTSFWQDIWTIQR